jgi:hypothetical protein
MRNQQWLVLGSIALAAGGALAAEVPDNDVAPTRAETRQAVLAARAAGQLVPAGEAAEYPPAPSSSAPTLDREEVRHEVVEARAAGTLLPAGEIADAPDAREAPNSPSVLARADVKAETQRAASAGELIPAGEGE